MEKKDLSAFYNSILNLKDKDMYGEVLNIVKEETNALIPLVDDLDSFCKYLSSLIEDRLRNNGIKYYDINLFSLTGVDHSVLICEYKFQNSIKRLLVDPTFVQFTKRDNKTLIKLKKWPSEKLDKSFVSELLNKGVIEVDNSSFNQYINAFSESSINVNLDEYLLNISLDKRFKK